VACGKSLKTTQNKATKYSSKINNFLCTPKVPKYPTNLAIFPKVNNRKGSKKLTKCLVFKHPKMAFYFWTRAFGVLKDRLESYKFSCFPKIKQLKKA
jgi:hypothetical protein